ncbi:MAG: phosphodiester glycosidase family protein [Thermacetogeniaceae bacterium]
MPAPRTVPRSRIQKKGALKRGIVIVSRFLLINILLFILTAPLIVLYGPFDNLRATAIGSIITSRHHDWLRYVLSRDQYNKYVPGNLEQPNGGGIVFSNSHSDEVTLTQVSSSRFNGYLLEVQDPTRVKVGVTSSLGIKGETTSDIAWDNRAVAAVNAGGFDDPLGTGTGKIPDGAIIHNGVFLAGGDTQDKLHLIGLDRNGVLVTGQYTVQEIYDLGIKEGISFGPTLIQNGQKQVTKAVSAQYGIQPRTAIGQKADGHILLLVIDGRQTNSLGASLLDIQKILYDNGAVTAANLDGGSSTTMYYNGKVINHPCDLLGERLVASAMVVN